MIQSAHIIFVVSLCFIMGTVGSPVAPSQGPIAESSPTAKPEINVFNGCKFQRISDFFACNCYFLETEGHSALLPEQTLDPERLKGAVSSCKDEFGPTRSLSSACVRMSKCKRYARVQKCFKKAKGKKFIRPATIKGMESFRDDCAPENE